MTAPGYYVRQLAALLTDAALLRMHTTTTTALADMRGNDPARALTMSNHQAITDEMRRRGITAPDSWPHAEQNTPPLPKTLPPVGRDDMIQILAAQPFRDLLERWLDQQGLKLFRIPLPNDLPTFSITFREIGG